ncbi:MAG TPA: hypothetical protein VK859_15900 [bacterium]|jgi:hypothetical protein|nr:hypothetical protein [bacterium]
MKRYFVLLSLALLAVSCGSKTPSGATPGSFSWNGPLILSTIENGIAIAEIATSSGPVTNAAVTLSYSGGPAGFTYIYSTSYPVTYSGGVTSLDLAYYDSSFTYTAGQPYTITAAFGGNTYSASTTAVGTPAFSTSGSNLVCTWVGGGNENVIRDEESVSPYTTKTFGPNLSSPATIANSSLAGASGQNDIIASVESLNNSAFSGTSNGSFLLATSEASTVY